MMRRTSFSTLVLPALALLGATACGDESAAEAAESGVPAGYEAQCEQSGVGCQGGESAPDIAGSYVGQGTTVLSSSSLWRVGGTETFNAVVTAQGNGRVNGAVTLSSMTFDVQDATIRGEGSSFTVYGIDSEQHEDCSYRLRGIISGVKSGAGSASQLSGKLSLEFTGESQGSGCNPEYPGTGATFDFSAQSGTPPAD